MKLFNRSAERLIINEILRHEKSASYVFESVDVDHFEMPVAPYSDYSAQYKKFVGVGDKNPGETIAKINKALLRQEVIKVVREKVFQKNLPYIHLAHYPTGYHNVGTFRVDCDKSDQARFENVLIHSDRHKFPMTWFIEVGAQEGYLSDIAETSKAGHDLQLHCYHHITYNNYSQNKRNIIKGKDLMQRVGIEICGFASPFGKWNPSLNRVLEELNFSFSSEFAMGYDDLPFHPVFKRQVSNVIQIPVHPICIGSLRDVGFTSQEMIAYYDRIIKYKFERNLPIMLYGHPKNEIDRFPEVIDFILSTLNSLPNVWITTYSEFAKWWQKRLKTDYSVFFENDNLKVSTDNTDRSLQLHLENSDNSEAFLPLENLKISLQDVVWTKKRDQTSSSVTETEFSHSGKTKTSLADFFAFMKSFKKKLG